ncbi:MAG: lysophospholipid acyltransferase family protein [Gallionellaceae bacterium]
MRSVLVVILFDLFARIPLSALHRLGAVMGWAVYRFSGKYVAQLRANLENFCQHQSRSEFRELLHANVAEAGKSIAELPWVWRRPLNEVLDSVRSSHGWHHVESALAAGKGLIVLTPHLGCFEVMGLFVAARVPMTSMYRVPKLAWLDEVTRSGRQRGHLRMVRADVSGVRAMYKALKRGETIGVLPDQVPGNGEGEWADFFGRPAYTMTLIGRLLESSGASVVMTYAERLPKGAGYAIHIEPLIFNAGIPVTRQINAALEKAISACPRQYLWSYNRYKIPSGVEPPSESANRRAA